MQKFLRCLLGTTMIMTLGSCAASQRLGRACDNLLTVRATPNGVETEVHPNVQERLDCFYTEPELMQQYPPNLGSGWENVTGRNYLAIPYGQWGANLWLVTHGTVVEAWYTYRGVRQDIPTRSWAFPIDNAGDGGDPRLVIGWRYEGMREPHYMRFRVINSSIR